MENNKKISTGLITTLIVITALNIFSLICILIEFKGHITFPILIGMINLAVSVFYIIYGYRKPHGNHMRYLLLFCSVTVALLLLLNTANDSIYINALYLLEIILVTYMAGRLDRYNQNIIISAVVLVCNIIFSGNLVNNIISTGSSMTIVSFGSCIGCVTNWLIIAVSYIVRYKPHREGGLEDRK